MKKLIEGYLNNKLSPMISDFVSSVPSGETSDSAASGNGTSGNGTSGNGTSGNGTSGNGTSGNGTSGNGTPSVEGVNRELMNIINQITQGYVDFSNKQVIQNKLDNLEQMIKYGRAVLIIILPS